MPGSTPPADTPLQNRLTKVFKFLKELNELRNPVQRDMASYPEVLRLDQWPAHPCIDVFRGDRTEDDEATGSADDEMVPLIRIKRAQLTPCPKPPEILEGWLVPGWHNVEEEPAVLTVQNIPDKNKGSIAIGFSDDEERVAALEQWKAVRAKWVEGERPAVAARRLFERIHALWTALQREGGRLELALGDGMLFVPDLLIRHPVLTQRINLEFDAAGPELHFSAGTEKVELNRALLRLVPTLEGRMVANFVQELEAQPVEPLGGSSTDGFLRRLVQGLFTDGEFLEGEPRVDVRGRPTVCREPVIFLRARTAGLSSTLDYIVEDLEKHGTAAPEGLARIVGIETDTPVLPVIIDNGEVPRPQLGSELDILFSKPANAEQYEIAARLAKSRAVLVQGPPGTGKTHTIANLLGYLLAQGKTVLVTAHTTKALRVLRAQVDEPLQPLCLSVLERDTESQAQLARAAQEIADRLSGSNAASLRREAAMLRDKRQKLLAAADALRRQLRDARFSEVEEIVIGGEGTAPIEAAKRVKADADQAGWIPGPIEFGVLCPLTDAEVQQLYASQGILTPFDEAQLSVPQPAFSELVPPADFRLLVEEKAGADKRSEAHRPMLWSDNTSSACTPAQLRQIHQRLAAAAAFLGETQHWLREVLFAGWTGGDLREAWQDLLGAIEELSTEAGTAQRLIMTQGPELPENRPSAELALTLSEIVTHLERGGTLGLKTRVTRRDWHRLLDSCHIDGRAPGTLDEFRALLALARLQNNRNSLCGRWRRSVEPLGGPTVESLGHLPERVAQGYGAEIRMRLDWRSSVWEPLVGELRSVGFRWEVWLSEHPPVPGEHGELARIERAASQRLAEVVEARAALLRQKELSSALQAQRTYLAGFPQSDISSVLLQVQDSWDATNYELGCRELARLEGLRGAFDRRQALFAKLEAAAPDWVRAIKQRSKPHDAIQPPGEPFRAWRWREWQQELDRRAAVSITDLQERLSKIEDQLRGLASQIIERETWAAQRERLKLGAQQALMGFVQTMRKIGKGTGKLVPELLRQARQLLISARSAVPVWIMPLSRVYESFDPRETKFDVVIIDEASQSDVTALSALYLGREHVVVGDKEQVTPDAIGQRLDDVQRLISMDLQGIPNSHLYDGQTSIYDLAETAFGGVVALREHFRCVPEIIQFSNHLSYSQTIRPLREPSSAAVRPALVAHRVNGFRDDAYTNSIEAEEVASLLVACLQDPDYARNHFGRPMSFGVISLLGVEQALLIEQHLRRRLPPDAFAKHRLLCGNAAQFQGDERDVIFLSMVDGPPDNGQLTRRDAGPKDIYKKRYNVAASRARDQLWVIYSMDPDVHLKSGDLRRRLIDHARDPEALLRAIEKEGSRVASPFEKMVLDRLSDAGYRVQPQWSVGSYRIDLVVQGESRKLAVECDGERWHTPEQLQSDLERQAILERLGWVFVRIRGSVFFRDPDSAMVPVFNKLRELEIEPLGMDDLRGTPAETAQVIERVRRRAQVLRAEWSAEGTAGDISTKEAT